MFGLKDKLVAIVAGGAAVLLAIALLTVTLTKNAEIRSLTNSIEAPRTGWRARLDACNAGRLTLKANQGTLEASIARQNASLEAMRAEAATKAQAAAGERQRAQEQVASANARAAALARRSAGPDGCRSADELIMESIR